MALVLSWRGVQMITTQIIPEFLNEDQPIDGARYVLADLGPDHRLDIYSEHPTYRAEADSWVFKGNVRKKLTMTVGCLSPATCS